MRHAFIAALASQVLVWTTAAPLDVAAQSQLPPAFTPEQIREMALTYVAVLDKKEKASPESLIQMSQFYGYVLGYLDSATEGRNVEPVLKQCTSKSPRIVALRAAHTLSTGELDRSTPVRFTVGVALRLACDDQHWKK